MGKPQNDLMDTESDAGFLKCIYIEAVQASREKQCKVFSNDSKHDKMLRRHYFIFYRQPATYILIAVTLSSS